MAFLFGLVHGLGFAGALKDIGLPEQHLPVALLTFNVGVETGAAAGRRRWPSCCTDRCTADRRCDCAHAALYAIGSMAAYWSLHAHRRDPELIVAGRRRLSRPP